MKTTFLALSAALVLPAFAADPATTAINELGLDLHRRLAGVNGAGNLCLSPYSIQCALAMTYAGAQGPTREEMLKVLHYPKLPAPWVQTAQGMRHDPPVDTVILRALPAFSKALADLADKSSKDATARSKDTGRKSDSITFNLANRLFGQQGYGFQEPYLALIKDTFQAPLEPMDFAKSAEATKHINGWVEKETKERIKNLLPDGVINGDTRLVLVNAVYLKAPWEKEFSESATKPAPFAVGGTEKKDVPTMRRDLKTGYAAREGYEALSLSYVGRELQFLILLPKDPKGLPEVEKKLTAADLESCTQLKREDVILHLPKFKLEPPSVSLNDALKGLGMKLAFNDPPGSADFSGIAPRRGSDSLYITDVVHKTFFAIDEKGTEAAAATAVLMAPASVPMAPPKPIEVKVDRPFLFAIQHVPSGACLFLGRVTDPR